MREPPWVPYAAVALLAAAVYVHTLSFGFVFDDQWLVVQNRFLREPWSILTAFQHHFWYGTPFGTGFYRPIVIASLALNGRLFGWGPAGFHAFNVLLHAGNAALVLLLARRLSLSGFAAGLSATLFAVHPIGAWPVGSVVARVDLLPALFILLAWIAWTTRDGGLQRTGVLLTGACFLGALLCKESAAAFLGIMVMAVLRPPVPRIEGRTLPPRSVRCLGLAASVGALGIYLVARRINGIGLPSIDQQVNPLAGMPWSSRVIAALALSGRYVLYLLFPLRFADPHDYAPSASPPRVTAGVVLAATALLVWVAAVLVLWWRRDRLALPAAFALGSFLPASNLLRPITSLYAQNFLYLPLIGLCLVTGEIAERVVRRARAGPEPSAHGRAARIPIRGWVAGAVVVVLGLVAARESLIWRAEEPLFRTWTRRFPNYALAHFNLGLTRLDLGDAATALKSLRRALAIDDRSPQLQAHTAAALLLIRDDREALEEALSHCRKAFQSDPQFVNPRVNAASILLRLGRPEEAEREAREAVRIAPDLNEARIALAESMFRQEKYREAAWEFGRLAAILPGRFEVRSPHVVSLIRGGDLDAARQAALAARKEFPGLAWFDFCLARVEARSGRRAEAFALLEASLAKDEKTRDWIGEVEDFDRYRSDPAFAALLASARRGPPSGPAPGAPLR